MTFRAFAFCLSKLEVSLIPMYPYQPLLFKHIFSLLANAKKSFFLKLSSSVTVKVYTARAVASECPPPPPLPLYFESSLKLEGISGQDTRIRTSISIKKKLNKNTEKTETETGNPFKSVS